MSELEYITKNILKTESFIYSSDINILMFTRTQLLVFYEICQGNNRLSKILENIKMNKTHISEMIGILIREKLITKDKQKLSVSEYPFALKLRKLLVNKNLIEILPNSGIKILTTALDKKTITEIAKETGLKEITIKQFIKKAQGRSIFIKENKEYIVNYSVWPDLIDFLKEYKSFQENYDYRVPVGSTIYYKNEKEIVFSIKQNIDATLTSFSAFKDYNLLIYTLENFYYLPKKKLTKQEILLHTLAIVEKTKEFRDRMYLALYYYKYKDEFKDIKHEILDNLNRIFNGEKIEKYPPLKEIKEKAKVYDIKM
jgi:DNA-binding MarR family transcriptional regulator